MNVAPLLTSFEQLVRLGYMTVHQCVAILCDAETVNFITTGNTATHFKVTINYDDYTATNRQVIYSRPRTDFV